MVPVIQDLSVLMACASKLPKHDTVDFVERVLKREGRGQVEIYPYGTYCVPKFGTGEREIMHLHLQKLRKNHEYQC